MHRALRNALQGRNLPRDTNSLAAVDDYLSLRLGVGPAAQRQAGKQGGRQPAAYTLWNVSAGARLPP